MSFLTGEEVKFFEENGYLIVKSVIDDATIDALWAEYTTLLDEAAHELFAAGRISALRDALPFDERYVVLLAEAPELFDYLEITLPLLNHDFPPNARLHAGSAVFNLLTHPNLLDKVESIIGGDILSNPVQHIRLKPPQHAVPESQKANSYIGRTTWHQDQGALHEDANQTQILTAWVAITDCPEERGCLVCVPGSHLSDGGALSIHCPGKKIASENYIPSLLLKDQHGQKRIVKLPAKKGSVVFLNQYTQHAALPNKSDRLRWSFDLRYNPIGQPTGRDAFPSFVARCRSQPERELRDPLLWREMWRAAKQRILSGDYSGEIYNAERWAKYANTPVCA